MEYIFFIAIAVFVIAQLAVVIFVVRQVSEAKLTKKDK